MARMMPAYCPGGSPPGERALYAALQSGDGTDDWIVLHSLGIADHVRGVEGEADFVVIVPGRGVLVIEVKSHRTINRLADGLWKLGNDAPTARGPFQQASEAMYSIKHFLEKRGVDLRSIPMLSAVWFTQVRARTMLPSTPEWHDWQVLDLEDLRNGPVSAVLRTLAKGAKHLDDKIRYFSYGGLGPDGAMSARIASLLRPRFEIATIAGDMRRVRQAELVTFIEEQYLALDSMADNQAVLFAGPAGSGKTLLAVEAAQREVAQGSSGRLLCFNKLLSRKLSSDFGDAAGLTVGTLHQELLRISGARVPPGAGAPFWERDLPEAALEVLLDRPDLAGDFLIVDEIQDMVRDPYLDVLDLMVHGGLANGRVLLFGDFERQAIFESGDVRASLGVRIPRLSSHRLTANCRNLPRIGYQVNLFSKLRPGYRHFRRQDDGVDPTLVPYRAGADQSPLLVQAVRALRDEGYELNEIVVLSPLRNGSTAQTTPDSWLRQVLHSADGRHGRPGQLLHTTIQAFKGLEAPAVVVTDLDHRLVPGFESLMYVGMTRATDRLFAVIESGTARMIVGGKL
ncbi:nuclease-related domain-containing DEAD/DEAH box helicase [Micromonospora coxensis]|uniref:PhoH-like protein n=1 Tax=Micromonospora coxensis TaxID=356852 RepID=A0A1C5GXB7_9ACTN|nr:NERD domain-containing protein/DEAD/DEAH box helicase [Micromonospora coxensis]SCG38436.1 PhoH-like protein [Micromonospora coxensis]